MTKPSPFRQAYGSGECGLCAIIAAVDTVCHNIDEETAGQFLSALAQALPAETAADLERILYEDGTERAEMERMLAAGLSQSFGVYPALSLRAAYAPPLS